MDGYLREATEEDAGLLFEWVNDATARQSAFDSHIISYEEHTDWFQKVLENESIYQYIYMRNKIPVGQVRIEVKNNAAELDYSVAPGYRMMGYGKEIIHLVKMLIVSQLRDVREITAQVKTGNIGSEKMLLDNGFLPASKSESYVTFIYRTDTIDEQKVSEVENGEYMFEGGRPAPLRSGRRKDRNSLPD